MDRLDAMSVFLAVVETGSLSAASRSLHSTLPTVSRKVAELEAHLGVRLITRTNRRVVLTEAGQRYVIDALEILERVEEAERRASGEYSVPKGNLSMTAPIVFGRLHLLPLVIDFLDAYPDINMHMTMSDRNVDLADDHIDVALRISNLTEASLIATRLGYVRNVVYASPSYLGQNTAPLHPHDLTHLDSVSFEGVHSANSWAFRLGKQDISVSIRPRLSVNTAEAAVDAAVAGLGVTRVMSYQAKRAVDDGLLVPLLEKFEQPPIPVHLAHLPWGLLPLKLRVFLDFATPRLRAILR